MKKKLIETLRIVGYILGGIVCGCLLIGVIILAVLLASVIAILLSDFISHFSIVKNIFNYGAMIILGLCLFLMGLSIFDTFLSWIKPHIKKLRKK